MSIEDKNQLKYRIESGGIEKESRVSRFFDRIHQFFRKEPVRDLKLDGRLHELHHEMDEILVDIQKFKKTNDDYLEANLMVHLNEIINPMIKELIRVKALLIEKGRPEVQVKLVQRCSLLLEKAKKWIELNLNSSESMPCDPYKVYEALINHHMTEFNACIDRDIQLIWNYLEHAILNLNASDDVKSNLIIKLKNDITHEISKLEELKTFSLQLDLNEISTWRMKLNFTRSKHFANILHLIDVSVVT